MALHEQNRMLQILYKNGVDRKNVKIIMIDLKKSCIFSEDEVDEDIDWDAVDQKAEIWFSELDPQEKLEAINNIHIEQISKSDKVRNKFFYEHEQRIQAKMREMEERNLTGPELDEEEPAEFNITRYGRSPLHEAIVMKDIRLVKKYVKEGLYLDCEDNNGHTPMEMALYEGYKEAMIIFENRKSKK